MIRTTLGLFTLLAIASPAIADTTFTIKDNRLVLPSAFAFETASAKLAPASSAALDHVKAYLDDKTSITLLRIENHSDNAGKADANLELSRRRAMAIAKALVAKGIDCKRLVAVGFGATKPVADNATADGRAANRRTEIANAEMRGRAIGGMPTDGGGSSAGDVCAK